MGQTPRFTALISCWFQSRVFSDRRIEWPAAILKISNGHISATGRLINVVFGSRAGI